MAGWINRHQQDVIDYLVEENRVLKGQMNGKRLRLTDDERRLLAVKGKALGRKVLEEFATIVTPDTILEWFRDLVAKKFDGSKSAATWDDRVLIRTSRSWSSKLRRQIRLGVTIESKERSPISAMRSAINLSAIF